MAVDEICKTLIKGFLYKRARLLATVFINLYKKLEDEVLQSVEVEVVQSVFL